jgi:hypothetical protein
MLFAWKHPLPRRLIEVGLQAGAHVLRGVVSIGIKKLEDALPNAAYDVRPTIRPTIRIARLCRIALLLFLLPLAALVTHSVSLHLAVVTVSV